MSEKRYRPWSPNQSFLLPPSPLDWLPEGHLVYFLLDLINELDLSKIEEKIQAKDPRGTPPYSPYMMTGLLIYGYCLGIRSSRKIERATYEDTAFRVLAGGLHPDHTRISEFRREHAAAFKEVFLQVLRLCDKAGLIKLGQVAIDGTKMQGNASKHKAMSYERMVALEKRLMDEIEQLMEQAEQADVQEDARFGAGRQEEDLPAELQRRDDRLARLREAKAALEEEARESRAAQLREQADRAREKTLDPDVSERERKGSLTRARNLEEKAHAMGDFEEEGSQTAGKLPRHRVRTLKDGSPAPKAQRNFTDPESRIMESGGSFLQGFNCQAAVDGHAQIIVAADVTNQCPDNGNLIPMLEQVLDNCGRPADAALADSGYWAPDVPSRCLELGTEAYVATERRRHWDRDDTVTEGPAPGKNPRDDMRWKTGTREGREIYARRKSIVEPVFGQIKEIRNVRRFLLRGLELAQAEWQLICFTHNLLKLFRHQEAATT